MRFKISILIALVLCLSAAYFVLPLYEGYKNTISNDPRVWANEISNFRSEDNDKVVPDNPIVFVGSSSIRFWKTLGHSIDKYPVLNRGFGGAKITDIDYYLDSLVFKYHPKMVVLYLGVVDIATAQGKSKTLVFDLYHSLCMKIRHQLPHAELVVIALRPSPYRATKYTGINRKLENMALNDPNIYFVNANDTVVSKQGFLRKDLYGWDRQHLNESGYSLWGNKIKKSIGKILNGG